MSKKKIRVNAVVNYIIDLANNIDLEITNLKLQKLLFFTNGFCYTFNNKLLFEEEMQSWQYGPVVPEIYYEFKRFGKNSLNDTYSCVYEPDMDDIFVPKIEENNNENEIKVIKATFNLLAGKNSGFLVDLSHRTNSPWLEVKRYEKIEIKEKHKEYFEELLDELMKE